MNNGLRHTSFKGVLAVLAAWPLLCASCATIRVTQPPRTADEQFLISGAAVSAIDQLSMTLLRDRKVYLDSTYLYSGIASNDQSFVLGEIRSRLLTNSVRIARDRDDAEVILEVRAAALGVNQVEYLLGIPSVYLTGRPTGSTGEIPVAIPELAILKNTKQQGFASIAFVAYWNDSGELIASSGPFVGRTLRDDFWFFGFGPRTVGNIPPAEK